MGRAVLVLFVIVFLVFPAVCLAENHSREKLMVAQLDSDKAAAAQRLVSFETSEGRAVLVVDGHVEDLKYFDLDEPARLILDLPGVVPAFDERFFSGPPGFKSVRIGADSGKTRIVFDALDSIVPTYTVHQLDRKIVIAWVTELVTDDAMVGTQIVTGAAVPVPEMALAVPEPTDINQLRQYLAAEREQLARQRQQFLEEQAKYLAQQQELQRSLDAQQRRIEEMQEKLSLDIAGDGQPAKLAGPKAQEVQPSVAKSETTVAEAGQPASKPKPAVAAPSVAKADNVASEASQPAVKPKAAAAPPRVAKADTTATKVSQPPARPVGRPPKKQREETYKEIEAIFERQGVLTPRGKFVLEPSLQYSYVSSTRVALVGYTVIPAITVGLIDIRSVNRNSFVGALAGRYGLTNRLELELKVPYVYRDDSTSARSINTPTDREVFSADGSDLGDIEFGFRYQFNMPKDNSPIFIGGIRVKSDTGEGPFDVPIDQATGLATELPTGSGVWSIQPSLTAIVPSDPAVFFGSVSYLYNIDRDESGFGNYDPGDTVGVNVGVGYGINEKASFSLGYEHNVIFKTKLDGDTLEDSITNHVGSVLLGGSYRLNDNTNLTFSLSGGLTEAAPDVQMTLRMPMSF